MSADGPDIHQLRSEDLTVTAFPGGSKQAYRVHFTPEIHGRIWQHAQETTSVEICGILVGKLAKDDAGPFVTITEAIRGDAATNKFAEVTFTHETWAKINHEMDTKYTHLAIVGWYHSHPDFGIFLSDRDLFIQQNFFSGPGQVAYVVDPLRKLEGVFIWKKGKPVLAAHYWVGDKIQVGGAATLRHEGPGPETEHAAQASGSSVGQDSNTAAKPTQLGPWFDRTVYGLGFFCLFLLGWVLSQYVTSMDRMRIEQDAIARAALVLGVKPGLRERLNQRLSEIKNLSKFADELASAHRKATGGPLAEDQELAWQEVRLGLQNLRLHMTDLQAQYCLSEEETHRLVQYAAANLAMLAHGLTAAQREQLARDLEAKMLQGMPEGLFETPPRASGSAPSASAPSATIPTTKLQTAKPQSSAPSPNQ